MKCFFTRFGLCATMAFAFAGVSTPAGAQDSPPAALPAPLPNAQPYPCAARTASAVSGEHGPIRRDHRARANAEERRYLSATVVRLRGTLPGSA
jgi:hypothetical protein